MFHMIFIDDEQHLVDSLADTIHWAAYGIQNVYKAYSAAEALEMINIEPVHIVVTDIRMSGMNGIELIHHLSGHFPHIQIIILSGYADFQYAQAALQHQVAEYLLKPVSDAEITEAVLKVSAKLRADREAYLHRQRQQQLFNHHLPLLRSNVMLDLLNGKRFPAAVLQDIASTYGIRFASGDTVYLVLIRMEGKFTEYDYNDQSLMAFSIFNMLQEMFDDAFHIWNCRNAHDYLVVLLKAKEEAMDASGPGDDIIRPLITAKAETLQRAVQFYLLGNVSVVISSGFVFPDRLRQVYLECVAKIRNQIGEVEGILICGEELEGEQKEVRALQRLYEPLTIAQLIDLGRWHQARQTLGDIIDELQTQWADSREHLMEVYYSLAHMFLHYVHGNNCLLTQLSDGTEEGIDDGRPIRSVRHLQQWAEHMLEKLELMAKSDSRHGKSKLVKQVNHYIETHLGDNISLQMIADHVGFNPSYLSRIYKLERGEGISEYSHRFRMDKARQLLKQTEYKIYEITEMLGYQNPQYFSKLFKKDFGCTPQEYRDKLQ